MALFFIAMLILNNKNVHLPEVVAKRVFTLCNIDLTETNNIPLAQCFLWGTSTEGFMFWMRIANAQTQEDILDIWEEIYPEICQGKKPTLEDLFSL